MKNSYLLAVLLAMTTTTILKDEAARQIIKNCVTWLTSLFQSLPNFMVGLTLMIQTHSYKCSQMVQITQADEISVSVHKYTLSRMMNKFQNQLTGLDSALNLLQQKQERMMNHFQILNNQ